MMFYLSSIGIMRVVDAGHTTVNLGNKRSKTPIRFRRRVSQYKVWLARAATLLLILAVKTYSSIPVNACGIGEWCRKNYRLAFVCSFSYPFLFFIPRGVNISS